MATGETIRLSAVESVQVVREKAYVRLQLQVGGVPVVSRLITPEQARRLGDALGFASIDVAHGHPLPQAADSTAQPAQQLVGGHADAL